MARPFFMLWFDYCDGEMIDRLQALGKQPLPEALEAGDLLYSLIDLLPLRWSLIHD